MRSIQDSLSTIGKTPQQCWSTSPSFHNSVVFLTSVSLNSRHFGTTMKQFSRSGEPTQHKAANAVVANRLPSPSQNDPLDYNLQPCCGVAIPVAAATP